MENIYHYVLICGVMMDVTEYTMNLSVICSKLLVALSEGVEVFYDAIDVICGRYLVLFGEKGEKPRVLQDATGMRSVFFDEKKMIVASHIELVQMYAHEQTHPFWYEYLTHNANIENNSIGLPGNTTPYQNIKALIPNHVLIMKNMTQRRFWPRFPINPCSIDEVCKDALICFREQAKTLVRNYEKICLSITAGVDSNVSRISFGDNIHKIKFFTYFDPKESLYGANTRKDCDYAEKYCIENSLEYYKLYLDEKPSKETLEICKKNTWQRHITRAVDQYLKVFSKDYLHVRSNLLEIIRTRKQYIFGKDFENDPESFYCYRYKEYSKSMTLELLNAYWYEADFNNIFDYDFGALIYWEERCGMWHGASVLLESDMAFDTYTLFNYRKLLQDMLSVDKQDLNSNRIYDMALQL